MVPLLLAALCVIAFTVYLIHLNSEHFRSSIEEKEQANLATISKGSAFQISEYLERRRDRLVYLARDGSIADAIMRKSPANTESARVTMRSGSHSDIAGMFLIDSASKLVAVSNSYDAALDGVDIKFEHLPATRVIPNSMNRPVLLMQYPAMRDGIPIGAVGMVIDLKAISARFDDPAFIDFDGYMQVFDESGTAIVHPDVKMLGMDAIAYRKERFPRIDWSGYAQMIQRMESEAVGVGFYDSIKSIEAGAVPSRKIAAFARVPYDGVKWSVLAASDYDQIVGPIIKDRYYTAALAVVVAMLIMFAGTGYWLYGKQTLRVEELDSKVAERTAALSEALDKLNSDIRMRMEVEERFRLLFTHNTDAILIMDETTGALYGINPAGRQLFGMECDECSNQELGAVLPESVMEFISKHIEMPGSLETWDEQLRYESGDAEAILLASAAARKVGESRVLYFSFKDVTERVKIEQESSLRLQQLIQADKMTALGTLVSGVAHEINNPNSFIMTNASIISRIWADVDRILDKSAGGSMLNLGGLPYEEVREEVPKLLQGMREGAFRIRNIVTSLKDFARKEDVAAKHPLNLNKVITDATVILGNKLKKLGDNFHLDMDESLPLVMGNAQQLEQVIINLLMNSMDAIKAEGRSIWVITSHDEKAGRVRLVVRDEGSGMSEEAIRRASEPFYTTKQATGGTGLGLYISFNIIKEHGAELSFSSEPGKGTTATVLIPVA